MCTFELTLENMKACLLKYSNIAIRFPRATDGQLAQLTTS